MSENVLLIGKPNTGKSLLFQKLTGLYQKVANFPGVTVEIKKGEKDNLTWIDFPGVYSLNPLTTDEEVAVKKFEEELKSGNLKSIVCVLDATKLERSLIVSLQTLNKAIEFNFPIVFAINMMDDIKRIKENIDMDALSKELGIPVVGVSAKTGEGLAELKHLLSTIEEQPKAQPVPTEDIIKRATEINNKFGINNTILIKNQNKMDQFFLSNFIGGLLFFVIMVFVFQSIFTWAVPLMDYTEELLGIAATFFTSMVSNELAKDFLNDAFFGGFGAFLVFAPQIAVLTFVIGILEDSGYLARAALIAHKPFKLFGLSGKSFVPYLSGHACAIPAIFAARTIESPRKRLLTILTVPLTSCSARLPVYTLFIVAFIPAEQYLGGIFGLRGLTFFGLYFFGIISALVVSAILSRTVKKEHADAPFIIELPTYRIPAFKPLIRKSLRAAWTFISKAGPLIFGINLIIWILGYFPNGSGALETSYLSYIGKWIEPFFAPLGMDWKYGVAILMSFLAREVFVGTLGTLLGIEAADENISSLSSQIQSDGLSFAAGIALLVFYALAMQCVSTLAVIKSETGSYKWPVLTFIGYTLLAYAMAMITFFALR